MEEIKQKVFQEKSKRSIATSIGVPKATLRQRLKAATVSTPLGRFKIVFTLEIEKKLAG